MKPNASATWVSGLRRGEGMVTTGSRSLSQSQYFGIDEGEGKDINPYELITAAHAVCFSMTLANELADAGFCPHRINTTATGTMEQQPAGCPITALPLDVLPIAPRMRQSDCIKITTGA